MFSPSLSPGRFARWRSAVRSSELSGPLSRAFTLIELLAVITIIAILSGVVVGLGRRASESGRVSRTRAELAALSVALEDYRRVCGDYPRGDEAGQLLQSLIGRRDANGAGLSVRHFIDPAKFSTDQALDPEASAEAVLTDPWGRPYRYAYRSQSPWANPAFVLYSAGPDGRDSGVLLPGGFANRDHPANADNLWADSR